VDLGRFYESAAIVPDGSQRPQPTRDPELYCEPSTVPSSHLPHVCDELDVPISTVIIGPGGEVTDIYGP
jgi:hypothetical protein